MNRREIGGIDVGGWTIRPRRWLVNTSVLLVAGLGSGCGPVNRVLQQRVASEAAHLTPAVGDDDDGASSLGGRTSTATRCGEDGTFVLSSGGTFATGALMI
jgi:hypothetical protein